MWSNCPWIRKAQMMLLVMAAGWIGWLGILLMSHFGPRRAPLAIRPVIRWTATGCMLVYASITLAVAAYHYGWTRIHRTVDVIGLALDAAGLICIGIGLSRMWHRARVSRQQANASG
jgi:hypothetical protein